MKSISLAVFLLSVSAHASLVTPPSSAAPVTAQSSLADKQAATVKAIKQSATNAYSALRNAETQALNLTFHNPWKLTAQQVEDALGTDACAGHMAFVGAGQLLNGAAPGSWTQTEACTVTCNQDGTASASCPEPSPSPSSSP